MTGSVVLPRFSSTYRIAVLTVVQRKFRGSVICHAASPVGLFCAAVSFSPLETYIVEYVGINARWYTMMYFITQGPSLGAGLKRSLVLMSPSGSYPTSTSAVSPLSL